MTRDNFKPPLQIIHAVENAAIFTIMNDTFFALFNNAIPMIFDSNLNKLNIPNVDSWIQAKTHQKASCKSLREMAYMFYCGIQSAYTFDELSEYCDSMVFLTISEVFRNCHVSEYLKFYTIESLDTDGVEKYLRKIRDNFDKIIKSIGEDKLHNNLCRFCKKCANTHNAEVALALIKRLGREYVEPQYPNTSVIDSSVLSNIRMRSKRKYKFVTNELVELLNALQSR